MTVLSDTLALSASGMRAQAIRLRHLSENIANVDTPGYHRKTIAFEQVMEGGNRNGEVQAGPVQLDRSELTQIYEPGHPLANENGYFDGSNVDLVVEIADSREAQRSYEANLKMFDQARQMSQGLLELLRK
ncbi:flagellar basal body rod protein FlgC [Cochlodiniinecator piscidefendens]|uniref:flagellar basal body rod protein FlgC n=1 Tax=Cochlodiniinecator piscidefendens TaxID=2715756 RepID=UPI00140E328A|nr:flagellar basal body rod protein FlgC [Cochlodiniinecator piscidefendens]